MKSWLASHINNTEWIPRTEKLNLVNRSIITTIRSTYTNIVWSSKNKNQVFDVRENFYGIWDPPELSERQTQMPINIFIHLKCETQTCFQLTPVVADDGEEQPNNNTVHIYLVYTQIFHFWSEIYLGLKNETPRFHFGNLLCSARSTTR